MRILDTIRRALAGEVAPSLRRAGRPLENIDSFAFDASRGTSVREDIVTRYGGGGDLLEIFANHRGHVVHKWHHYLPLYERYLSPFRGKPLRFLEIGVSKGGSLDMWRAYFGPDATIFGIDVDPACAGLNGRSAQVRIGSQCDEAFLESVVDEMGGIDVVLDDGSHRMPHIARTLRALFPRLVDGGIYMIEDLHTAYWPRRGGGGIDSRASFFRMVDRLVDDMHRWYHPAGIGEPAVGEACFGIHIHDSLVVLDKNSRHRPSHSQIG